MYLGTRKYYDPGQHEKDRAELIKTKPGAVNNTFIELEGLLNKTQIATQYFERTQSWLAQKLKGCMTFNPEKAFTEAEYAKLAESLRHIARRLQAHADEIDAATLDTPPADD